MAKGTITPSAIATNNIKNLPDVVVGQATPLKELFDKSDVDQQDYINNTLITELNGNNGSNKIGHNSPSFTSDNVKDAFEEVQTKINNVVLGQIPDGSLTDIKLSNDPSQIKGRVSEIRTDLDTTTEKITNSFYADIDAYFGNVLEIVPVEQSEDTGITLTGGAYGTTGLKVGANSYGADNVGANKVFTIAFTAKDLTKLNNGETSTTDDYITLPITITGTLPTSVRMELASSIGDIDVNDFNQDLAWSSSFQVLKFKKSSFTQTGTPNWNSIGYIRITTVGGDATTDVWFDKIQLVKKDPESDYPNPIQKNGVREFAINSGEWFVGREFGKILIKQLASGTDIDALIGGKLYSSFKARLSTKALSGDAWSLGVLFNSTNYVKCDVENSMFRLLDGNTGNLPTTPFAVSNNDIVTLEMEKVENKVIASAYKNGDVNTKVTLSVSTTLENGYIIVGTRLSSDYYSASITEIAHAHHADIAEVAKGLTEQSGSIASNTTTQSLTSGTTDQGLTLDVDTESYFFDSSLPLQRTIRESGKYLITLNVDYAANTTGSRDVKIKVGGTQIAHDSKLAANFGATGMSCSVVREFSAGNIITATGWQNSGGALNVTTRMEITKVF